MIADLITHDEDIENNRRPIHEQLSYPKNWDVDSHSPGADHTFKRREMESPNAESKLESPIEEPTDPMKYKQAIVFQGTYRSQSHGGYHLVLQSHKDVNYNDSKSNNGMMYKRRQHRTKLSMKLSHG